MTGAPNRPRHRHQIRSVLFDLDGTLADTAPDLAYTLNRVLASHDLPPRRFEEIRPQVSHGSGALLRLGFGLEPGAPGFKALQREFLAIYRDNIHHRTRLFPGMPKLLQTLGERGLSWGVVTNKPTWLTLPLLQGFPVSASAGCVVSGDTTPYSKPHPEPLIHACQLLGISASACVYVGDAQRDIEAGRRAGAATLTALFGYIGSDEQPAAWGADAMVRQPGEILDWIDGAL